MTQRTKLSAYLTTAPVPALKPVWVPDERVIQYCPDAEFHHWLNPIVKAAPAYLIVTVCLFVAGAASGILLPVLLFLARLLLEPLKPLLTQTPSGHTADVIGLATTISWFVYAILGSVVAFLTVKGAYGPTHLSLTRDGLAVLRRIHAIPDSLTTHFSQSLFDEILPPQQGAMYAPSVILSWADIALINVERPAGKKSIGDYRICLTSIGGQELRLRYGDIVNSEDRQRLLAVLKGLFPQFLDDELLEVFKPPLERQSYTELWLKELSAAPKRDKLAPLSPGDKLHGDNYTILSKIGVGGQGIVYMAQRAHLGDTNDGVVALKEFVLPVFPDPRVRKKAAEKFQKEAEMLAKLEHPQIVKFLELFVEDHRAYLVLERAEGSTLKELVATEGAQPESYVIELSLQLCRILSYLHSHAPPVVHRDFTPDNLILGPDGIVRLIDFSVAQELKSNLTGSVVGKPNYLSPEQFRGKPTTQSDLYSLGATMFYLLTGEDPSPISVSRPKSIREEISRDLDNVVARATQLDCERRYASVDALANDLQCLQHSL